jgi:hypothetical protein
MMPSSKPRFSSVNLDINSIKKLNTSSMEPSKNPFIDIEDEK